MPNVALRPCLEPRCPALVRAGRCEAHGGPRPPWQAKPTTTPRLRGVPNQHRRRALFRREPLCRVCAQAGRVTIATIRDHIIPLAEGGLEGTDENEQPLCARCSLTKTHAESRRGQSRL